MSRCRTATYFCIEGKSLNYKAVALVCMTLLVGGCQSNHPSTGRLYRPAVVEPRPAAENPSEQARAPVRATVEPIKAKGVIQALQQQGRLQLQQTQWREAIVTGERGLRVDRREASFYWLLARAYQGLDEMAEAAEFARQGLRYAPRGSTLYHDLKALF